MSRPTLVFGTNNRGKGVEIADLLAGLDLEILTLADLPGAIEIDETGQSFAENAALKATLQARHLGRWVLGDDSGLAVDALNGGPGIYSARYAGPDADDEANRRRLLVDLADVPLERRAAHFVCHLALSDPSGKIRGESSGGCHGRICFAPVGDSGFGYDPLFEIVEYHRTFAELGLAVKACLSHRARAAQALLPQFDRLLASGEWSS